MGVKSWIVRKALLRWLRGKVKVWKMGNSKMWKFFDGWKTVIGVVVFLGAQVYDQMANGHAGEFVGSILAVLGFDAAASGIDFAKVAGSIVLLIGVAHKLIKAGQQAASGAKPIELLSNAGVVRQIQAEARAKATRR